MERRLAAILAADVVGYTRLIRANEEGTLATLQSLRADLVDPTLAEHNGRIFKTMGDGLLVEFASVVDAVRAAAEVQQALAQHNAGLPDEKRIEFRLGINLGDVVIDGDDIHGDGVNVAARLEGLSEPGGIRVSGNVYEEVRDRTDLAFEDLGEQEVKNIDRPVRVWRWVTDDRAAAAGPLAASESFPLPDKPSIAVLPFDNMSGDPEQEYFSDGIAEDIITTLSKVPDLFVTARNSTFTYKGESADVKQVARELGVRYVVKGSTRKAGDRVRITAQLIDAESGHHVWAERYDRDLSDIFAIQDDMTREIVTAVEVELTEGEQIRVWREAAGVPAAYEHFSRGREHYSHSTKIALAQAREEFERALALNPKFAAAYAYLGWTHAVSAWWRLSEDIDESLRAARDAAATALSLDATQADAQGVTAYVTLLAGDYEQAVNIAQRAAAQNPNNADIHNVLAIVRNYSGDPEMALVAAKHALRLSPRMLYNLLELAHSFCLLERYADALRPLTRVLADRPYWLPTRVMLVVAYMGLGRSNEAQNQVAEILKIEPDFTPVNWAQTQPYKNPTDLESCVKALREAGLPG